MAWLQQCDLFVAEVSGSSFGLGFEPGYLLRATDKKVVLFYRRAVETKISLLITGTTHPNCQRVPYSHLEEAEDWIRYTLFRKSLYNLVGPVLFDQSVGGRLPSESQPVIFSVHGAIAEHYKVNPATLKESHSSTMDSACDRWCKAQPAGAVPALGLTAVFSQLRHDTVDDWVGDTVR
jgi:hypothetical protein